MIGPMPGYGHEPTTAAILLGASLDLIGEPLDALVEPPPVCSQILDDAQHARREGGGIACSS
jgi:hypothetical protein